MVSTLLSREDFKINPAFAYSFKKYQIKLKTDLDLSSYVIDLSYTFMKKINKSLSIHLVNKDLFLVIY